MQFAVNMCVCVGVGEKFCIKRAPRLAKSSLIYLKKKLNSFVIGRFKDIWTVTDLHIFENASTKEIWLERQQSCPVRIRHWEKCQERVSKDWEGLDWSWETCRPANMADSSIQGTVKHHLAWTQTAAQGFKNFRCMFDHSSTLLFH